MNVTTPTPAFVDLASPVRGQAIVIIPVPASILAVAGSVVVAEDIVGHVIVLVESTLSVTLNVRLSGPVNSNVAAVAATAGTLEGAASLNVSVVPERLDDERVYPSPAVDVPSVVLVGTATVADMVAA